MKVRGETEEEAIHLWNVEDGKRTRTNSPTKWERERVETSSAEE